MAEPTTAIEALTSELLGDVVKLHDEVKALKDLLPGTAEVVASALNASTGKAVAGINTAIAHLEAESKRIADQARQAARDGGAEARSQLENRAIELLGLHGKAVERAVASATMKALEESSNRAIAGAVLQVQSVSNGLNSTLREVQLAGSHVTTASKQMAREWYTQIGSCFLAAIVGAAFAFFLLKASGTVTMSKAQLNELTQHVRS